MPCVVCGQFPQVMCFKNTPWCCENHRKIATGECPSPDSNREPSEFESDASAKLG